MSKGAFASSTPKSSGKSTGKQSRPKPSFDHDDLTGISFIETPPEENKNRVVYNDNTVQIISLTDREYKTILDLCKNRDGIDEPKGISPLAPELTVNEKLQRIQDYINSIIPNRVDYNKKSPKFDIISRLPIDQPGAVPRATHKVRISMCPKTGKTILERIDYTNTGLDNSASTSTKENIKPNLGTPDFKNRLRPRTINRKRKEIVEAVCKSPMQPIRGSPMQSVRKYPMQLRKKKQKNNSSSVICIEPTLDFISNSNNACALIESSIEGETSKASAEKSAINCDYPMKLQTKRLCTMKTKEPALFQTTSNNFVRADQSEVACCSKQQTTVKESLLINEVSDLRYVPKDDEPAFLDNSIEHDFIEWAIKDSLNVTMRTSNNNMSRSRKRNMSPLNLRSDDNMQSLDDSVIIIGEEHENQRKLRKRKEIKCFDIVETIDLSASPVKIDEKGKPESTEQTRRMCPICFDVLKDQISSTFCGHIFCTTCIEKAVRASKQCPTCRQPLSLKKVHPLYF